MFEKRPALWVVTKRVVVISDTRFKNTEYSLNLKMGPIGCPETSTRNYHYSPRNNPEERISHLLRGDSLKSRNMAVNFLYSFMTTCLPHPTNSEPIHVFPHLRAMSISTPL